MTVVGDIPNRRSTGNRSGRPNRKKNGENPAELFSVQLHTCTTLFSNICHLLFQCSGDVLGMESNILLNISALPLA